MNYQSLYDYLRDVALNVEPDAKFFHGRIETLFETIFEDDQTLYVYLLPLNSTGSFTAIGQQVNQVWNIGIIFYKQDRIGSEIDQNDQDVIQTEMDILRQTSQIADEYVRRLNFNTYTDALEESSDRLTIESFSLDTVIKDTPALLTGTALNITMRVPDDFNYCS